jgi:phenylpropionate dioxygenase-like ring-hydroxylating dioxygenase large terminal subunit
MTPSFTFEYEVRANWKAYVENGLDGYHIGVVHDMLAEFVPQRRDAENFLETHSSYTHAEIAESFREMFPAPEPLSADEAARVRFGFVFPTFIPVVTAVDVSYLCVEPIDNERLRLRARSFAHAGGPAEMMLDFRRDSFDRTNQQDIAVVERVQRGSHADFSTAVHASHLELRIHHFQRMLMRALRTHHRPAPRSALPMLGSVCAAE